MTEHAPFPETVRLIARILGTRKTPQEEVSDLIGAVHHAVNTLNGAPETPVAVDHPMPAEDVAAEQASAPRTRRPRSREVFAPAAAPEPVAVAPKLMRRAEIAPAPIERPTQEAARTRTGLRGIVKWYDPKTRIGSLRLPGHDDVAIDGDVLDRAGMPRLFKGQEIEASIIAEPESPVRLLAVSLPGRPETESLGPMGSLRRQHKPVVIEMKRDAMRRVGARLEAEQILGGRGR
jgi:hypothetical protein